MKKSNLSHFWAVVSVHLKTIPWFIWPIFLPLTVAVRPSLITDLAGVKNLNYNHIYSFPTPTQFWLMPFLGFQWIYGIYFFSSRYVAQAYQLDWKEFAFTRAINRKSYYWGKTFLFWLLCLSTPILTLIPPLKDPQIIVEFHQNKPEKIAAAQSIYQNAFPDFRIETVKETTEFVLPEGKWSIWALNSLGYLGFTVAYQLIVFGFLNHPWKKAIYIAFFVGNICYPILWVFAEIHTSHFAKQTYDYEKQLGFINHFGWPIAFLLLVAGVASQRFCCRQFTRQEVV